MGSGRPPTRVAMIALAAGLASGGPWVGSAAADPVRFCAADWRPYSYPDGDGGRAAGVSVDILTEAARRAGTLASVEILPWSRCVQSVIAGKRDAAVDAGPRDGYIQTRAAHTLFQNVFFVRADSPLRDYVALDQFRGRTVGLVRGYSYPGLPDLRGIATVVEAPSDELMAEMLAAGRIDVAVGDPVTFQPLAVRAGKTAVRALAPAHNTDRLRPAFHPSLHALADRFDAAIAAMLADGTVDRIYTLHLGLSFSDLDQLSRPTN